MSISRFLCPSEQYIRKLYIYVQAVSEQWATDSMYTDTSMYWSGLIDELPCFRDVHSSSCFEHPIPYPIQVNVCIMNLPPMDHSFDLTDPGRQWSYCFNLPTPLGPFSPIQYWDCSTTQSVHYKSCNFTAWQTNHRLHKPTLRSLFPQKFRFTQANCGKHLPLFGGSWNLDDTGKQHTINSTHIFKDL